MTSRHAEFEVSILDLLDFIDERVGEALQHEPSRIAAVAEAAGGLPTLRKLLLKNEEVLTKFMLVLDNVIDERRTPEWWDDFAKARRGDFERTAWDLDREARKALRPLLVGSLDSHGDPITGLLSLPEDALPPILQMMIADRFKFFVAHGSRFSHRRATLNGFRLERKLDPDDRPEGVKLHG